MSESFQSEAISEESKSERRPPSESQSERSESSVSQSDRHPEKLQATMDAGSEMRESSSTLMTEKKYSRPFKSTAKLIAEQ